MARFGAYGGTERWVLDEAVAREWLAVLVDKEKVAFATQKQALNALVFFYRDVCGRGEVDLQVKMRRTTLRQPVILNRTELMGLIEKLQDRYRPAALLQYGAGLRLKELVGLRLKDVDLERGVLTVRAGKGDKDRETVIPNCLKEALSQKIEESLHYWQEDRRMGVAGVALSGALARKMGAITSGRLQENLAQRRRDAKFGFPQCLLLFLCALAALREALFFHEKTLPALFR